MVKGKGMYKTKQTITTPWGKEPLYLDDKMEGYFKVGGKFYKARQKK